MSGQSKIYAKRDRWLWLFLMPSLLGFSAFFLIPFVLSLRNALAGTSAGISAESLASFIGTFQGESFRLAFGNTLLFLAICVPANILLAYFLAAMLMKAQRRFMGAQAVRVFALIFLLPLVMPSGSVVYLWKNLLGSTGLINKLLLPIGAQPQDLLDSAFALPIVVVIFLWKNVGYNMILFWTGLSLIPQEYYEAAAIDGAGRWAEFRHVTFVYLLPTSVVVVLMSIVNSFKGFREIFMLTGNYPNPSLYMLQHYMNNQFFTLNLQKLTAASYALTALLILLIGLILHAQRRITDSM